MKTNNVLTDWSHFKLQLKRQYASKKDQISKWRDGCSFIAKLSWIFFFFEKMFFAKYTLFAEKMFLYGKKVLSWKFFLMKKTFFTEQNVNENVKIHI